MPISSLVIYVIGPSIAKAILKIWLKDQGILPDVVPDLLDLLKSFTQDQSEQRQAARRIESIGAQIVQQIQPIFEDAGSDLDDSSRTVVAQEVAATLAAARLHPRVLVECNLDSVLLTNHLKFIRPNATKLLSATETALYTRLLTETASAIAEIATDLQGFDTAYAASSLQDNDKILEMVSAIWHRPDQANEEFERKYRELVQQRLDRFEPFGLPKMDATTHVQRLTHVYITLQFERYRRQVVQGRADDEFVASLGRDQLSFLDEGELPVNRVPVPSTHIEASEKQKGDIDQLLSFSRRLVIRGDAGSGKSTLLQWLAVRSAGRTFTGLLSGWNNVIPFFIRLRERVERDFPAPEEFISLIDRNIAGVMPQGWVHHQLETGRALVLIDGVDELPQGKREELLQALTGLVIAYPLARYIVTSRPAALQEEDWPAWSEWTAAEGFTDATLQPMTPDQVNLLIRQWHNALEEKISDVAEIAEIRQLPDTLIRTLRRRPALRRLTTNPLLCSMICALHRDSRENLPSERLKLYEQCVEMLLTKRDEGRKVPLGVEYARLTPTQQRALVEHFAYWMMRNDYSDVSVEEADQQFADRLPSIGSPRDADGLSVRRYFVERTSLLREPIDGRIDFTHRTFQEFLAAHRALKDNDLGFVESKASDDQWRELIILAAGIARPREAERLLRRLVDRAKKLKRASLRHRVLLLAVACLETCVELDPGVREYVIGQARSLFPPTDPGEARLVSAAGDPAVPLLIYNPHYTIAQSVACVRALAQIGTDAAMHAMADYMVHTQPEIQEAIVDSWDLFDRTSYARHVLAKSSSLVAPLLTSWEGFEYLRHLKALAILDLGPDIDLIPLSQLASLIVLSIGDVIPSSSFRVSPMYQRRISRQWRIAQEQKLANTKVTSHINLTPISTLPALKHLSLSGKALIDLAPLANFTGLTQLSLNGDSLTDLAPLASLTGLTQLSIRSDALTDVAPLASLTGLTQLTLNGDSLDLAPLASLTGLTHLSIRSDALTDLAPLASLTGLTHISIRSDALTDLAPLANLNNLKDLELSSTRVRIEKAQSQIFGLVDLTPLRSLTGLIRLTVTDKFLQDVAPLAELTNLTKLNISVLNTNDLAPLSMLTELTSLHLRGPKIRNLAPLSTLTKLTDLSLLTNARDLAPLINLVNLIELSIVSNVLSDLTPLAELTNLDRLLVVSNTLSDLTPLSTLTALRELYIASTQVNDLTPLANLNNLAALTLSRSSITDFTPLGSISSLRTLSLYGNKRLDRSKLEELKTVLPLLKTSY